MEIKVMNETYEIEEDNGKCFNMEEFENLYTDYFLPYDYILGDYSYDKLRLKGFFDSNNKKVNKINNIKDVENYINKYCAFNCKYFILKKRRNWLKSLIIVLK